MWEGLQHGITSIQPLIAQKANDNFGIKKCITII